MKKVLLLLALVVVLGGAAVGAYVLTREDRCTREWYIEQVRDVADQFDDTVALAGQTPRMQLAPLVREMQGYCLDIRSIDVPDCAEYAHEILVKYCDLEVAGFTAFLGQEDDSVVSRLFSDSETKLELWQKEVVRIGQ